ncbi:MAG TPA: hypothetical protein PLQ89_01540 [Phycisphaerae bacterium]|nr:hypothetical protein [Phycisphaerae bacterium]HOJ72776.1 hypothetical protein [Phycisphaerae bacterium]HOM51797.1 hypothetical protein [Phycisphaerae bacterium]HON69337.1 hypothetical protein [Phycisphaerae bacterium]HOQ84375.1 hypothetical protein [Phycisphaerae bacterium]
MKRFMKVLTVASMSSVYLMQAPCTSTQGGFGGNGLTIIPTVPSPVEFLQNLPIIGGFF